MNNRYEAVSNSIQEFSELFLSNPLNFLNEYEVQCEYMAILKSNLDEHFEYYNPFNKEKGKFSAIRREYQIHQDKIQEKLKVAVNQNYRIDTVVLDNFNFSKMIENEDDWNQLHSLYNHSYLYNYDVDYGIEFKICLFRNRLDGYINATIYDADKLNFLLDNDFINTGIAICCFNKFSVEEIKEYIENNDINKDYNYVFPDNLEIKENCINVVFIAGDYMLNDNERSLRSQDLIQPNNQTVIKTAFNNEIRNQDYGNGKVFSRIKIFDHNNLISKYNLRGSKYVSELDKTVTIPETAELYMNIEQMLKDYNFVLSTPLISNHNDWGFSKNFKFSNERLYNDFYPKVFWIAFSGKDMQIEISERFLAKSIKNQLEEVGVEANNKANYFFEKGQGYYLCIQEKELKNYRKILDILLPLF